LEITFVEINNNIYEENINNIGSKSYRVNKEFEDLIESTVPEIEGNNKDKKNNKEKKDENILKVIFQILKIKKLLVLLMLIIRKRIPIRRTKMRKI
jgi:hypothetical protein